MVALLTWSVAACCTDFFSVMDFSPAFLESRATELSMADLRVLGELSSDFLAAGEPGIAFRVEVRLALFVAAVLLNMLAGTVYLI